MQLHGLSILLSKSSNESGIANFFADLGEGGETIAVGATEAVDMGDSW
jgi:hypothetical protein